MRSPQYIALRRNPDIKVNWEVGWWMGGRIKDGPLFEMAFENWQLSPKILPLPGVPVTYLGLFDGKRNLAEFQFGFWAKKPGVSDIQHVLTLFHLLQHIRPVFYDPQSLLNLLPRSGYATVAY